MFQEDKNSFDDSHLITNTLMFINVKWDRFEIILVVYQQFFFKMKELKHPLPLPHLVKTTRIIALLSDWTDIRQRFRVWKENNALSGRTFTNVSMNHKCLDKQHPPRMVHL